MASSRVLILLVVLCGLCEIASSHKRGNHTRRDPEEEYKALFDSINEKVKFPIPAKKQQGAASGSRSGSSSDDDDDDFGDDSGMYKIFTSMSGSLVPAACQSDADCKEGGLVCSRFLGKCVAPGKQQNGTCVRAQVCNGDSDCCPGETCDNYSGLLTINRCREGNSSASVAVSSDSAKAALKPTVNGQSKSVQSAASSGESAASSEAVQPNAAKVSVSSSKKDKGPMGAKKSKAGYPTVPLEAPVQPAPTDIQTDIQPEVQPVPEKTAKPVSVKGSAAAQSSSTGQNKLQVDVAQPADAAPATVAVNNDTGAVSVSVPGAVGSAASASKANNAVEDTQGASVAPDASGDEAEGSGQEVDAAKDAAAAKPAAVPEQNDNAQSAQSASAGPNAQTASGAASSSSSGQNGNGLKGKSKAMPLVEPTPESEVQNASAPEPAAPVAQNPENPNEIELSLMQAGNGGVPPKVLLSAKTSIVRNKSRSKGRASSVDSAAGPNSKNDGSRVIPPAVKPPY